MAPQGLLMSMELFKVLVLVLSRWSNHWHRINSSLLTIVKLFCSRSKNPKCVKAFLEIRFCVLGWLLLRPRWVVMPSFKYDYNDRLVAVNRGINYLLHFTFTIDHVGWVGSSISKMCVGCILSDIQRNKFYGSIDELLTTLLLFSMTRVAECRAWCLVLINVITFNLWAIKELEENGLVYCSRYWGIKVITTFIPTPFTTTDKVVLSFQAGRLLW